MTLSYTHLTQPHDTVSPVAPAGFDRAIAYALAQACALSYQQYAQYPKVLPTSGRFANGEAWEMVGAPFTTSEALVGHNGTYRTVPIGFVMKVTPTGTAPRPYNVICLRGTRSTTEWLNDAEAVPEPFRVGTKNGEGYGDLLHDVGAVHGGFLKRYQIGTDGAQPQESKIGAYMTYSRPDGSIAQQVYDIVTGQIDQTLPLFVTGHSLGAALAVLCAMDVGTNMPDSYAAAELNMINFAGPLVAAGVEFYGVPIPPFDTPVKFVDAYNAVVNSSWRVVNAADLVPMLPPGDLDLWHVDVSFQHVTDASRQVSFCHQTNSIGGNHSLDDTYLQYMAGLAQGFS